MSLRCAYCHDAAQDATTACPRCGTQLHADCWRDAAACPTLGCRAARVAVHGMPGPVSRRPRWVRELAVVAAFAGAGLVLVLAVIGFSRMGAPRIEVRNDSGRTLSDVRLVGYQLDAGKRESEAAELAPGETITLSGEHADYELDLHVVTFGDDGRVSGSIPRPPLCRPRAVPWSRSIYAIDAVGRLRTVVQGDHGGEHPCTCPDGNASGEGSDGCQVPSHETSAAPIAGWMSETDAHPLSALSGG